jgi:hypothetical protein
MAASIGILNSGAVGPGDFLLVAWQDVVDPQPGDWIGVWPHGAADDPTGANRVVWSHSTGYASGTLTLKIPDATPAGTYDLRMYARDLPVLIAQTTITLTRAATPTPSPTPSPTPTPTPTPGAGFDLTALLHNPLVIGAAGLLLALKLGLLGGRR